MGDYRLLRRGGPAHASALTGVDGRGNFPAGSPRGKERVESNAECDSEPEAIVTVLPFIHSEEMQQ
ncbi:MAG: hypothetical protein LUE17_11765 [Planctomycetaceae bacterium]|nr:hypothetical protein [Planctomycetaceae bacterium]